MVWIIYGGDYKSYDKDDILFTAQSHMKAKKFLIKHLGISNIFHRVTSRIKICLFGEFEDAYGIYYIEHV